MLTRLSFNYKRHDNIHVNHHAGHNEKENNQKHLNRSKRTSRLNQMDSNLIIKPLEKSYQTNTDLKMNLNMNYNSTGCHQIDIIKPTHKITGRNSLQKNHKIDTSLAKIRTDKQKTNTEQFCQLYGENILKQHQENLTFKQDFLKKHQITPMLRARMLDWMVQVMKSYKFINKTYFSGVQLMDRYFQYVEQGLPVTQLHIIGVISMFVATKMQQVYPLKVKTVYEKIVHKKISKEALVEMEMKLFNTLNHQVNCWSFFDLAMLKVAQNSDYQDEKIFAKFQEIISFLGKIIIYDYELYRKYDMETLANVVVKIAGKICKLPTKVQNEQCKLCREEMIGAYRKFKQNFKGLQNIFKFTEDHIIQAVDSYCMEYKLE